LGSYRKAISGSIAVSPMAASAALAFSRRIAELPEGRRGRFFDERVLAYDAAGRGRPVLSDPFAFERIQDRT
jgi:hypothetical protein